MRTKKSLLAVVTFQGGFSNHSKGSVIPAVTTEQKQRDQLTTHMRIAYTVHLGGQRPVRITSPLLSYQTTMTSEIITFRQWLPC